MLLVILFFSTLSPAIFRPPLIFLGEEDSFGFFPLPVFFFFFFFFIPFVRCASIARATLEPFRSTEKLQVASYSMACPVFFLLFFFEPFFFLFFVALFFRLIFLGTRRVIVEISRWLCSPLLFSRCHSVFVIFAKRRCFDIHAQTHAYSFISSEQSFYSCNNEGNNEGNAKCQIRLILLTLQFNVSLNFSPGNLLRSTI